MTIDIADVTRRVQYAGSGTGPYNFTFNILDDDDIAVYQDDTLLIKTTDYSVTINADGTGSITTVASQTGFDVTIIGSRPYARLTDYSEGGDFFASTINDELDSILILIQQLRESIGRNLSMSATGSFSGSLTFPPPGAGEFLRWNVGGTALETVAASPDDDTFTQSGTGAVSRSWAAKVGEVISVTDFMTAAQRADETLDVADAVTAADVYAAVSGAELYFPPRSYKLASKVTKDPYTTWRGVPNSQFGVTANDAVGTSGSRIVAGFNGTLVEIDDPGSEVYCGYAGFKGLSFFNNPATYAAAKAIVFNDNARQIVVEDFLIKGFQYGLYGSIGEVYLHRGYILHTKYCGYFFSSADSWFDKVHFGSGSQTVYASGGIGLTIINSNNIIIDNCRLQVQISGPGCQVQSSRGIHFINPIVDQNDTNGIEIIDSTDVDIDTPDIFDNGTVSVNAAGVKVTAQGYGFTADASSDTITLSSGSATWASSAIVELTTTGTLPAGLATGTQYYVIAVNATTTFKLATNFANARAGTAIDIADAGTGTHTIHAVCGSVSINGGRIQDRNLGTAAARQNRAVLFSKGAGGGIIRNVSLNGVDVARMTTVLGSTASVDSELRITDCPGWDDMSTDNGNAGTTLTIGDDAKTQIWNTPLTQNRSITLATTGLYEGAEFHVIRTAASTGAFNLSVSGLKNLAVGEWCVVKVFNGAWSLTAFGSL
jgi:hypothetical protein